MRPVTRYICQCGQLNDIGVECCSKCHLRMPASAFPLSTKPCEHEDSTNKQSRTIQEQQKAKQS